jgi:hypothetical protein
MRVRAALTAGLFALGIVVGAAIGPAPQSSLAGTAVNPKALIASLLARSASGARAATTSGATETETKPAAKPSSSQAAASSGAGASSSSSSPAAAPAGSEGTASTPATTTPAASAPSTGKSGTGTPTGSTPSLPAIEHVWLILLPGEGMASASAQSTSDPYLAKQLVPEGTVLTAYSPLAANALLSDAALLSGGSAPQESVLSAPGCDAATQPTCTPGSAAELASVDAWLQAQIPQITASADYKHGLIAIAFTAPGEGSDATTGAPASSDTATGATPAPTTLAAQPVGVLLLSPFLRKQGSQSSTTFHPATPRKDLEGLLKA